MSQEEKKGKGLTRRKVLRASLLGGSGVVGLAVLAGCGETQIVEREVVKVVTQEVPVEKIVTQIVEKEVVVEKIVTQIVEKQVLVEKIVTQIVEVAPAKAETVTIRWANWVASGPRLAQWNGLLKRFTKEFPTIKVQNEPKPWPQHWDSLAVSFPAGNAQDVIWFSGATFLKFAEDGVLLPIDEFVKARGINLQDFWTQADVFDFQGKLHGVPFFHTVSYIMINQRMFADAGVEEPPREWNAPGWDWNDWREKSLQLHKVDSGGKVEVFGTWVTQAFENMFGGLLVANDGDVMNPAKTKMTLGEPKSRAAMRLIYQFIQEDKISPIPADPSTFISGAPDPFARQVVAIRPWSTSSLSNYIAAQIPFDTVAWPTSPNTGHTGATYNANPNTVSKATKFPDQALEFAFWLAGPEIQDFFGALKSQMPSHIATADDPGGGWLTAPPKSNIVANEGQKLDAANQMIDLRFHKFWLEWVVKIQEIFEKTLIGEQDFDEAIDEMDSEGQKILEAK
jgi:multiple sugar transport system substrate-binding protein